MTKTDIDYSNTIIYKITCKDIEVKDVYVGHTTNFVQRKHAHKQGCNNPKSSNYDCKLYNTIREKGGWSNWKMEIINFFNCYDHYEARQKEQEYFILLNANLNSIEPMPKPKVKPVVINPVNINQIMEIEKLKIRDPRFVCEKCNFKCYMKCDWDRHVLRPKHINNVFLDNTEEKKFKKTYTCKCNRNFTTSSGLWKHEQKCGLDKTDSLPDSNLIIQLIKQNQDFKEMLIEQNTKMVDTLSVAIGEAIKQCSIITNNNTVNSNNKTFNLQVFLNEDCKDAMNISDFVDSIKFQLSDLEHMGQVGYVEGISNIIIKNMKALDITKRPVHCTDQKRETIYIKDEGVWIKEDEDNKNVRKLIKRVAFRNSKSIRLFKEKYPDCVTSESKYSDTYNKIVLEAMGGGPKCNDYESENKIIKKLAKIVTIDKQRT